MKSLLLIFTVFLLFSCEGQIWFGQDENTPDSVLPKAKEDGKKEPLSPEEESAFEQSPSLATPRLSQREFENIVREIFGIDGLATSRLPPDVAEPFDTDQETKEATNIFVEGIESMAFEVAKLSAQNTTWVEQMAGCAPSAPDDETCLES